MVRTGNTLIDDSTAEWVIGSDEAGYGTWAGSLIVCAVAVPRAWNDTRVKDSKAFNDHQERVEIVRRYQPTIIHSLVTVTPAQIDSLGVWPQLIQAHNLAHKQAREKLLEQHPQATFLHIIDGLQNAAKQLQPGLIPLVKADTMIPAVSLASCFAKVVQCMLMDEADKQYPGYGFASHRGYHSERHTTALQKYGPCPIHRKSFSSIKKYLLGEPLF